LLGFLGSWVAPSPGAAETKLLITVRDLMRAFLLACGVWPVDWRRQAGADAGVRRCRLRPCRRISRLHSCVDIVVSFFEK
jgi:hypothetical protein